MIVAPELAALEQLEMLLRQIQEQVDEGLRLLGEHRGEEDIGDGSASP